MITTRYRHMTVVALLVTSAAAGALAACGGDTADQAAVKHTLRAYVDAVLARDGKRACALLTPRYQQTIVNTERTLRPELPNNCPAVIANLPPLVTKMTTLRHVPFASVIVNGNTARATPDQKIAYTGKLTKIGGRWYISSGGLFKDDVMLPAPPAPQPGTTPSLVPGRPQNLGQLRPHAARPAATRAPARRSPQPGDTEPCAILPARLVSSTLHVAQVRAVNEHRTKNDSEMDCTYEGRGLAFARLEVGVWDGWTQMTSARDLVSYWLGSYAVVDTPPGLDSASGGSGDGINGDYIVATQVAWCRAAEGYCFPKFLFVWFRGGVDYVAVNHTLRITDYQRLAQAAWDHPFRFTVASDDESTTYEHNVVNHQRDEPAAYNAR